ncbi:MAG: helix-turn-helix domain-containing protein [Lachnospiraceae bacterium]|nr:helix-turn-helix domain-containing protein [Lachnospiraceae bacterium]
MKRSDITLNRYASTFVKEARLRRHLSQDQMAELLNISARCYQTFEEGRCGIGGQTLCRLLVLLTEDERNAFVNGLLTEVWPF